MFYFNSIVLNRLLRSVERKVHIEPHPWLICCTMSFRKPYPTSDDIEFFALATMELLIEYVYPAIDGYCKFTVAPAVRTSSGEVTFTAGPGPGDSTERGE